MGSTKFSLCWTDHESSIVENFRNLLQSKSLVDCIIAAEGQYVKVHRLVLSATSSYFQMLFEEDSNKQPIVFLKDVKFRMVMAILEFIYSGNVQIPEEELEEFFVTAQSLQIKGLSNDIKTDFLSKDSDDVNVPVKHKNLSPPLSKDEENTMEVFEELIPANEDNYTSNNPASSSLDHQYCAENGEIPSLSQVVVEIPSTSELTSIIQEEMNEFNCRDGENNIQGPSSKTRQEEVFMDSVTLGRLNDSNESSPDVQKGSPSATVDRRNIEKSRGKSPMKTVIVTHQPRIISQKSGTIMITKPVGIYPMTPIQKQKVVLPSQSRQAIVVGSKVLALPHSALLSGRKEWLQPPKPRADGKLYRCPECNKTFRKPSILVNHQRTHTGEKPFQCHKCGRMFNQSSNFRRHQRAHTEPRIRERLGMSCKSDL